MTDKLRVALLTREYPPEVYGGAGVHVTYLARELAPLVDLTVHCQGADRPDAVAHRPWDLLAGANQALQVVSTDLSMAAAIGSAQLVHSHTWYANLAGHLAAMLYDIPHVVTMHSLEVLRPWKAEQLGGGYAVSSWCEREAATSAAAVVAVSEGMRADIMTAYPEISPERIRVIRNGIDTNEYWPDPHTDVLDRYGIGKSRPYVIFVGRITRQKGLPVLLRAASELIPEAQLVLCAGQADTPEQQAEVTELVEGLRATRSGVIWIPEMLPKSEVIQLLTHATVFACPSVYEPLGIVNLEAMACGTAVVGSRTGGIPEVVADGETGLLVPPGEPEALAVALNTLLSDPDRAQAMGQAGRKRAVAEFGWPTIAAQTAELYAELTRSGLERRGAGMAENAGRLLSVNVGRPRDVQWHGRAWEGTGAPGWAPIKARSWQHGGMKVLHTPEDRFTDLPAFGYPPRYADVGGLRLAYVETGPADGEPVLLLHGEPSWSFLYRKVMPVLADAGLRAIAADLVGFGRSDKPTEIGGHSFAGHVEWIRALAFGHLDLRGLTIVGQDWGGLIGLRLVAEHPDRFARVVAANTGLPTGDQPMPDVWLRFREVVRTAPTLSVSRLVQAGCQTKLSPEILAAYEAPFPDPEYDAAVRAMPGLVPTSPDDPATEANRAAWRQLATWDKPFLVAFSDRDPITGSMAPVLKNTVPGAAGIDHPVIEGAGHFLQEDAGERLGAVIAGFVRAHPA